MLLVHCWKGVAFLSPVPVSPSLEGAIQPSEDRSLSLIDDIIARRRSHRHFDEQLWEFVDGMRERRLEHLGDTGLQRRLVTIEQNIQYLDTGPSSRDELIPEKGWESPWWWLRLRHWTLLEM